MKSLLHANDRPAIYPPSYYAATANQKVEFPTLQGVEQCDVAIIGAGFTGLSAALHLAEAGIDVCVLDAHRVGWGASGRNGGQVASGMRVDQDELEQLVGENLARSAFEIGVEAASLVRDLVKQHKIDCDYKPGIIHANHKKRFDQHSKAYVDHLKEKYNYESVDYLPPEAMTELVGSKAYSGGSIDRASGHLHPLNYALGLAAAASKAGVRIFEASEVTQIAKGRTLTLQTKQGSLQADRLLLAANGYLEGLNEEVSSFVMPINNFIATTEPLSEEEAKSLISNDAAVADSRFVVNYFRLSADRRMLFGGGETYGYRFPKDIAALVRKPMLKIYPQLADKRIDYAWGGTLAITLARLPFIRQLEENIFNASGYSGSGVAMATMAGKIMADHLHGDTKAFDIFSKLPTSRFPGGRAMRSPLLALALTWYALRDAF